eukprot:Nk52_evm7s304 gene=Nk52_evmTU7s304
MKSSFVLILVALSTLLVVISSTVIASPMIFRDSAMNTVLKLREESTGGSGSSSAGTVFGDLLHQKKKQLLGESLLSSSGSSMRFTQAPTLDKIEERYFDQKLLHNDNSTDSATTWKQRYFINPTFWKKPDGPVFFVFGGEGAISEKYVKDFAVRDYAEVHGALIVSLEHRYYGLSMPTEEVTDENLFKYLHSRIALQDAAHFARSMNDQLGITGRWITFGGSYPGALAAFARVVHPDVFHAAVSTSGPVEAVYDFHEYLEVTAQSLQHYGFHTCADAIQASFEELKRILYSSDALALSELKKTLGICEETDLNDHYDRFQLMTVIVGYFQGAAQYNMATQELSLQHVCENMKNPLYPRAYEAFVQLIHKFAKDKCVDGSWKKNMEQLRDTRPKESDMMRQWTFQTCNEFGYYQTTDSSVPGIFGKGMPVSYSDEICRQAYGGKDFDTKKLIDETNAFYGGRDLKQSNILFVNGKIDPWHALSVVDESHLHENQDFILLEDTSHCETMHKVSEEDTSELKLTKKLISKQIQVWLSA